MTRPREDDNGSVAPVGLVHGAYWIATGVWPFFSMSTFEGVSGPKREHWLVKTVGGLLAIVGGTLARAALRRRVTPEVRRLGILSAGFLGGVDAYYVVRGRISPVYLVDAAAEAALVLAWTRTATHPSTRSASRGRTTHAAPGPAS